MEDYMKKAATAFLVGRPYGMRVDLKEKDMCCSIAG